MIGCLSAHKSHGPSGCHWKQYFKQGVTRCDNINAISSSIYTFPPARQLLIIHHTKQRMASKIENLYSISYQNATLYHLSFIRHLPLSDVLYFIRLIICSLTYHILANDIYTTNEN